MFFDFDKIDIMFNYNYNSIMSTTFNKTPSEIEQVYVLDVYDQISEHFDQTRHTVWDKTKEFLDTIPNGSKVIEIGCGNGRNLAYLDKKELMLTLVGVDTSRSFIEITRSKLDPKNSKVMEASNLDLSEIGDDSFDYTLSVAVIHHFSTVDRRRKAIEELVRITKPGGFIFIEVWAKNQPKTSKRKFEENDNFVSWKRKKDGKIYDRFYHVFDEGELVDLISNLAVTQNENNISENSILQSINKIEIVESFYANGNWGVILKKL